MAAKEGKIRSWRSPTAIAWLAALAGALHPLQDRRDLAVGMEEGIALPLPLLDRARERVLRLQLEDTERAGLAVEDEGVEVGARRAAPLQFDPSCAQDEAPVAEEAVEILPEDPLAQMGAVVILLRVAAAQFAREEDKGLAEQPTRRPDHPPLVETDQRRRGASREGAVVGGVVALEDKGLEGTSDCRRVGVERSGQRRDQGPFVPGHGRVITLGRATVALAVQPADQQRQDSGVLAEGRAADRRVGRVAVLAGEAGDVGPAGLGVVAFDGRVAHDRSRRCEDGSAFLAEERAYPGSFAEE